MSVTAVTRQLGKVEVKRTPKGKEYSVTWFISDTDDLAGTYKFAQYQTCGDVILLDYFGGATIDATAILREMAEIGAGENGRTYRFNAVELKYQFS